MADQAILRGLHLASMVSMLGAIGFLAFILPAAGAAGAALHRPLIRLWRISGVLALLAGAAWFVQQSALISGADSIADLVQAMPVVAKHTRYGQAMLVRFALLLAATLLAGRARVLLYPALPLAAAALGMQGVMGHAGAMEGGTGDGILASEALHLIAAGLWFGALVPLWQAAGQLPPVDAALVCERFSPIGLGCVLVIAGSGFAQAFELIGGLPALFGTPYGQIATLKIALFLVALVLAALNRLWLTDRVCDAVPGARSRLRLSLAIEALVGLAIILAAGFLASNAPGIHEQRVSPFDPAVPRGLIVTGVLFGLSVLSVIATILWRRTRTHHISATP